MLTYVTNYTLFNKHKSIMRALRPLVSDIVSLASVLFVLSSETVKYLWFGNYDRRVIECVERLASRNVMYVKVLQSLSGSTNLISDEVNNFITKYTDNVPFTSTDDDYDNLKSRLQTVILSNDEKTENTDNTENEKTITHISKTPIKSGSVSIVYEATIGDNEHVVVKVLRTNARRDMVSAIRHCKTLSKLLRFVPIWRHIRLDKVICENESLLMEQLDFSQELANIKMFRENNKDRKWVKIPKPYPEYTESLGDVIVMERLYGKTVELLEEREKQDYAYLFAKFSVLSVIADGVYHGDLHRGNILFMRGDIGESILGIYDFGIVGRLNNHEKNNLTDFYFYLGQKEYRSSVEVLLKDLISSNKLTSLTEDEYNELVTKLEKITERSQDEHASGFGANEIIEINYYLANYGLCLAPEFCRIELSMAMSGGIAHSLETEGHNHMYYFNKAIYDILDIDIFDV